MANQDELDKRYLAMAKEWSKMSQAKRKKVGCLIVKDERIISDGFNGMPSRFNNECENNRLGNLTTKPEVLHAESNALMKLARSTNSSEGATIYCTYSPCFDCAKLIIQAGIKRVVYNEAYRCEKGLDLLKKAKVKVYKIN